MHRGSHPANLDFCEGAPAGSRNRRGVDLPSRLPLTSKSQWIHQTTQLDSTQSKLQASAEDPSDSSSDSSGSEDNRGWSSIGDPPSDPDSLDSGTTKKAKQRAKRRWNAKLLRFKLEQLNAKPDPPFVYDGEPNFDKIERWIHESKSWVSVGGISERHLIVRFWDGAHTWIQKEWAYAGYNPETASLKHLVRVAVNYEQAKKLVDTINEKEQLTDESDTSNSQTSESAPTENSTSKAAGSTESFDSNEADFDSERSSRSSEVDSTEASGSDCTGSPA
ncbi:hypothetical protein B0H13DRAFT_1852269 [Mycena leptocephala]|nr:hypothetical protein B0H13DRAFT_1852269 [Mycena leptocephala]